MWGSAACGAVAVDTRAIRHHHVVAHNGHFDARQKHGNVGIELADHAVADDGRPVTVLEIEAHVARPKDLVVPDGDVRSCRAPYPTAVHVVHGVLLDQQRVERKRGEVVPAPA